MIQGLQICDGSITVCTAKGRLTFPEIRAKVLDLSAIGMTPRVLCDLTQATVADLTSAEIEDVIKLISYHIAGARGAKAAILAHSGVDYGLARMFGTFVELAGLPIKVRVFRTSEIAKEWLKDAECQGV
jgi:hypothetical protein